MLETWRSVLQASFQDIWLGVADIVPKIVVAIIIFIIGWVIGSLLGRVVEHVIKAIKLDSLLKGARVDEILNRGGIELDSGRFLGALVEWFVIVVFLVAAVDVLGLEQVNAFLQQVLAYIPQVIVSVIILLVAAIVAEFLRGVVVSSVKAAGMTHANFLGNVTKWVIWIFGILAALVQLNIAAGFINTLFTGVIVAISLALGLAFGLGGQDAAGRYIDRVREEISHKK